MMMMMMMMIYSVTYNSYVYNLFFSTHYELSRLKGWKNWNAWGQN